MIKEFIEFVDASFPSIPYAEKDKAKEAVEQFKKTGKTVNYLHGNLLSEFSQGDILSDIPFLFFGDDGKQHILKSKAMVINTSCHIENKGYLTFVPLLNIDNRVGNLKDIQNNTIYEYMYLPDDKLKDFYIDFSMPSTYSKGIIDRALEDGKVRRIASLSQIGYYLLIVKLNIYLTRREDPITQAQR